MNRESMRAAAAADARRISVTLPRSVNTMTHGQLSDLRVMLAAVTPSRGSRRSREYKFRPFVIGVDAEGKSTEDIPLFTEQGRRELQRLTSARFTRDVMQLILEGRYADGRSVLEDLNLVSYVDDRKAVSYTLRNKIAYVRYDKPLDARHEEERRDIFGGDAFGDTYMQREGNEVGRFAGMTFRLFYFAAR